MYEMIIQKIDWYKTFYLQMMWLANSNKRHSLMNSFTLGFT